MTDQMCQLIGTVKQVKWANAIRQNALAGEGWTDKQLVVLNSVSDSTWWLANRHDLKCGDFKAPAPWQVAGGPPPPAHSNAAHRQMDLAEARQQEQSVEDSAKCFAASVSKCPAMAECVVLALLARLYKPDNPLRKKLLAHMRMILADNMDLFQVKHEKDLDALQRIIPKN